MTLRGGACRDVFVFLESGSVVVEGEERPLRPDDAARLTEVTEVRALAPSDLVIAYVFDPAGGTAARGALSAPGCTALPTDNLVRCDFGALEEHRVAEGKLAVRILFDADNGARLGALSLLAGAPDLAVGSHAHESSVEALYILSGSGEMTIGDRQLTIGPGVVAYVPENTLHDLRPAGTTPLRAIQIYAGPGPEQRFRAGPTVVAPSSPAETGGAPSSSFGAQQHVETSVTGDEGAEEEVAQ